MSAWDMEELRDMVIPAKMMQRDIHKHTRLSPTAIMLPLSVLPNVDEVLGLPVYRGDRVALIYEAGRSMG